MNLFPKIEPFPSLYSIWLFWDLDLSLQLVMSWFSFSHRHGCVRPKFATISNYKVGLLYDTIVSWVWVICLFVCLFWIRTRICPAGSTPEGGPTEKLPYHPGHSSPPGLVVLHVPYPPILIVMHPASGQSPPLSSCPIQISYQVSGLPPPCLPVLHM